MTVNMRKRIYETGALLFAALTLWGLISVEESEQLLELVDSVLATAGFVLARMKTPAPETQSDGV